MAIYLNCYNKLQYCFIVVHFTISGILDEIGQWELSVMDSFAGLFTCWYLNFGDLIIF